MALWREVIGVFILFRSGEQVYLIDRDQVLSGLEVKTGFV